MKEKNKQLHVNRFFRFVVIPLSLLALWLGLTCLYIITFDTSLSVLSYIHGRESFKTVTYSKLLKDNKITGQFKAVENNLGIVSVKFQTFIRPPYASEDILVFRFKEKGAKTWYSQNTYRDGMIYEIPVFPFGFPKIANSQGKIYQFEIQSLNGDINNSVALSNRGQNLFSKYQVSKTLLLHNKKELTIFLVKKFVSAMLTTDVRFSSFIYLLPFLFYLIWISPFGKKYIYPYAVKLKRFLFPVNVAEYLPEYYLSWIMVAVVLLDIFIIQLSNDVIYVVMISLWIVVLRAYKLTSNTTFLFALLLLLLPPYFLVFKDAATAEKAAVWAFMFLVAGTIQALLELNKDQKVHEKD
jgi:hypothetical protein